MIKRTTPSSLQPSPGDSFRGEWLAALACFVLAALTGSLFRFSAAGFEPLSGLDLGFVRNAHSHLMLFSWATPLLMAIIARAVAPDEYIGRFRRVIRAALVLGVLSFAPFLVSGYGATQIGPVKMPLSIIFSTVSMLVWYAFAYLYMRVRHHVEADAATRLWDLAAVFLVLGSAGAWARGAFMGMGVEDPLLTNGSIQFFLVTFSFGWLMLGMLGELHRRARTAHSPQLEWAFWMLAAGVPVVFATALPTNLPVWLDVASHLGSVVVAAALLIHVHSLWSAPQVDTPQPSFLAFAFVAAGMLAAGLPPLLDWANSLGLKIVFIHVLLLGMVSLGLVESYARSLGERAVGVMSVAVAVLLLTMLPTTGLWPGWFGPRAGLYITAFGSLAPTVAALWLLARRRSAD